jgi:hypothetical protein
MEKKELEKLYEKEWSQNQQYSLKLIKLKRKLTEESAIFRDGLAEETDYNAGVEMTLNFIIDYLNHLFNLNIPTCIDTKTFTIDFNNDETK